MYNVLCPQNQKLGKLHLILMDKQKPLEPLLDYIKEHADLNLNLPVYCTGAGTNIINDLIEDKLGVK
jgi:hypothetical protein